MKTTLEIPAPTVRRAKSVAARRGVELCVFVSEAIEEMLPAVSENQEKPWVCLAGGLKHLHKETLRINEIMKREFERYDESAVAAWKDTQP